PVVLLAPRNVSRILPGASLLDSAFNIVVGCVFPLSPFVSWPHLVVHMVPGERIGEGVLTHLPMLRIAAAAFLGDADFPERYEPVQRRLYRILVYAVLNKSFIIDGYPAALRVLCTMIHQLSLDDVKASALG